jgi:tetratricopeptide (TPR) repeat protein
LGAIGIGQRQPGDETVAVEVNQVDKLPKKWKSRLIVPALSAAILVIGAGCGGEDDNAGGVELTARELTNRGWSYFEDQNYGSALRDFEGSLARDPAYADAWNGAGWAAGKLPGRLAQSMENFRTCYERDPLRHDALGGWVFATYQSGEWTNALARADTLLGHRPGWQFEHQPSINEIDIQLIRAKCFYNLQNYDASLGVVSRLTDGAFDADINSDWGVRELLREIERLSQLYG